MVSRRLPVPVRKARLTAVPAAFVCLAIGPLVGALVLMRSSWSAQPGTMPTADVAKFDTLSVPVPIQPVTAGTALRQIALKLVEYPKAHVPDGALLDTGKHAEAVALVALPAGLPLFAANFSGSAGSTNPVIEKIPPGMRAMTVKVDATSAVEGWAGSGSSVDVLLVEKNRTSVIAEGVKILSAERTVSPVEGNAAPNVPSTVTLLVTQEQCLAINTAIPLGRIAFALRGASDQKSWERPIFTASNLRLAGRGEIESDLKVRGLITMHDGPGDRAFALTGDKWVPTDVLPEGFRLSSKE